jgi:glutaredoxin
MAEFYLLGGLAGRHGAEVARPENPGGFAILRCLLFAFLCNFSLETALHRSYNRVVSESRLVVIYSRKGCHLCEVVKESLEKLARRGGFTWQEVDVDSDGELRRQFNDEVPVVFIDGRKAFKYRMDEREFLRKLAS